jgi:hypothetical protein
MFSATPWIAAPSSGELARRSAELGHQINPLLGHDDESIAFCGRCGARIYARHGPPAIRDGEALSDPLPQPACLTKPSVVAERQLGTTLPITLVIATRGRLVRP